MQIKLIKYKIFLGKGAVPLAPPKSYICINFDRFLIFPPNTHSLMKRRAAPLQPPEIILYFSVNLDQKGPEIM